MSRLNLRQAREHRGLDRAYVSAMVCVPEETLKSWEDGTGSPEMPQGLYLAMLYNMELSSIDFSLEAQRQ